jgi:peptidoglycan/xylan/chitin deacetylase (PgdA/CDA1 family)
MMTFGEVRSIADGGIVELGAHTVSHSSLAAHSREYQRREMYESQKTLTELVDQPIDLFAYPHGEYTAETLEVAEELGFSGAFTTNQETVTRNAGLLELPRFQVEDWDGDEFERQLGRWMWR